MDHFDENIVYIVEGSITTDCVLCSMVMVPKCRKPLDASLTVNAGKAPDNAKNLAKQNNDFQMSWFVCDNIVMIWLQK